MTFTLYKKDIAPEVADFNINKGEVGIITIENDSDISFDEYLKYLAFFRNSINRKDLVFTAADPVPETEVWLQFENEENFTILTSTGDDGITMELEDKMIESFIKDFTIIHLDGENTSICSPFIMIGSQFVPQAQFDVFMYWKTAKIPRFSVTDENTFIIDGVTMNGKELMNHPLFNQIIIQLYIRNFSDEPLFFFSDTMTEDDVRNIINNTPSIVFDNHPPIMFVLKEQ